MLVGLLTSEGSFGVEVRWERKGVKRGGVKDSISGLVDVATRTLMDLKRHGWGSRPKNEFDKRTGFSGKERFPTGRKRQKVQSQVYSGG